MNVPSYITNFIADPDTAFARLSSELDWERRDDAPRSEYYCNDTPEPYTYGKGRGRRTYEVRPGHETILAIRHMLEAECKCSLDTCFLNRYLNQRDHLGWHADDSPEMDDARPIVSVSLGVEREIWIRPQQALSSIPPARADGAIQKFKLGHGSAFIMPPGFQDLFMHSIPKASFTCGERISLTFRGYLRGAWPDKMKASGP